MADVIITFKIMASSPDADLKHIENEASKMINNFGADIGRVEIEPVAFGIKAVKMIFIMKESIGSTESLEAEISKVEGVESVEVTDVRRALG